MTGVHIFPEAASTAAVSTDRLFLALLALFLVLMLVITVTLIVFAVRYRRGTDVARGLLSEAHSRELEIGWTLATLLAFLFIFVWAASQNLAAVRGPIAPQIDIHVVAKQWMWKIEHPGGQREIDTLHLPVNRAARLFLNSEDVIHSFFVPAFRVKMDLVPGRDEQLTFEPTRIGTFDLFCTEFCGTAHSEMRGKVVVMSEPDYALWLEQHPPGGIGASNGVALFSSLGCNACHRPQQNGKQSGPPLEGVFGRRVNLADGRVLTADDAYVRNSILAPKQDIVAGYEPVMPSYAGRISEAQLIELVDYVRALGRKEARR